MRYLFGPEILWLILYGMAALVAKANVPPSKSLDKFIENCWFWVPLMALLMFALWWLPTVEKRWLLLRVWIAGLVGGHYVLDRVMRAYSEQGPGIGTAYIMGMIFVFVALVTGSVVVRFR